MARYCLNWEKSFRLSAAPYTGAGHSRAVLAGLDDGRVNLDGFVACILRKHLKDAQLNARPTPARVAQLHRLKVATALWQVWPDHTCVVAVQHGLYKELPVPRCYAHMTTGVQKGRGQRCKAELAAFCQRTVHYPFSLFKRQLWH